MKLTHVLFIVIATFVFASCSNNPSALFREADFSWSAECKKDYNLVYLIEADSSMLDAYGRKLELSTWYVHSTKAQTLIPYTGSQNAGKVQHKDLSTAVHHKQMKGYPVELDTVRINSPVYGNEKLATVEVVLTGLIRLEIDLSQGQPEWFVRTNAVASK